jgi:hypothetical protein
VKCAALLLIVAAACGDNTPGDLEYTNPTRDDAKLRLIQTVQTEHELTLALVVGKQPLTGYSAGFNLPLDHKLVTLVEFTPGKALDPGSAPAAAQAIHPKEGPLANMLVAAISQKSLGTGAIETDTTLAPNATLLTIRLSKTPNATAGVVFDGTDAAFLLPSGGMRDRSGTTVVEATEVAVGKLEVN